MFSCKESQIQKLGGTIQYVNYSFVVIKTVGFGFSKL